MSDSPLNGMHRRTRITPVLVFALAIVHLFLLTATEARAQASGILTGVVTTEDASPLRLARVSVAGTQLNAVTEPDGTFRLKADLVLLAMGFLGPRQPGMLAEAGVALDARSNIAASVKDYRTSVPRLFAAGDMRRGQSLVVWAIREGRQCARSIDEYLMGTTELPR